MTETTVLGYPRIGPRRELKRALEAYWEGSASRAELAETGRRLRAETWRRLAALGLSQLPSNTFTHYDQVLDTAVMLDAVPDRYRDAADPYFAMARGADGLAPLRMTKWFDTNYHYIVPEVGPSTRFRLADDKPILEVREARELGLRTRPVLVGPVTFLLLAQPPVGSAAGFAPLDRLDDVLDVYAELLAGLAAEGVDWVQLDEPALVADRTEAELDAVRRAYHRLGRLADRPKTLAGADSDELHRPKTLAGADSDELHRPKLLVASYFGDLGEALPVLAESPVEGVAVDLVRGRRTDLEPLAGKTVFAGIVSGRDVWRTDLAGASAVLRDLPGEIVVSTSCSLLHVPYNVDFETRLDPALRQRLAFAEQKVTEVVELARLLDQDRITPAPVPAPVPAVLPAPQVAPVDKGRSPYPVRAAAQAAHLGLPMLPVTTIGSFPQTGQLRAARAAVRAGQLDNAEYERSIEAEIERVIRLQERLGLDVLVHGEPERNDMVQYFAEHLDGFATTEHGWVQSYGSRCTRPPILHGNVHRPAAITVRWSRYAQSLTDKPVKGMLTGPVTIVAWSFVRRDRPLSEVVGQVAEAVREELQDLAAAGISIVQVDEPALRELVPLRRERQAEYLDWAVRAYRRATSGASDRVQIHTHLCYSDAADVLAAIEALDADVTTIESARSGARILAEPAVGQFPRGLGPGVYDIHSPRVPPVEEVAGLIGAAVAVLPVERVWVNPDCGLKTRGYREVEAALANVVAAARQMRDELDTSFLVRLSGVLRKRRKMSTTAEPGRLPKPS